MTIQTTKPFDRDYALLPESMKRRAEKQFRLLLENPRHPSLRIKKMEDPREIWEGSITKHYRFTFQIIGEIDLLRRIGIHEMSRRP